jgi:hypothetical protein
VLDGGKLVEFDHPFKLLAESISDDEITRDDTVFSQMVRALNETQQDRIFNKAKTRYVK